MIGRHVHELLHRVQNETGDLIGVVLRRSAEMLLHPLQAVKKRRREGVSRAHGVGDLDFASGNGGVHAVLVDAAAALSEGHADGLAVVLIAPALAEMLDRPDIAVAA